MAIEYNQVGMRVVSIAAVILAVAALFFGNCLTCPQMAAPSCCHQKNQTCHHHQPACQSPLLSHFVKANAADHAVNLAAVSVVPESRAAVCLSAASEARLAAPEYAPPDLLSLNSTFRI